MYCLVCNVQLSVRINRAPLDNFALKQGGNSQKPGTVRASIFVLWPNQVQTYVLYLEDFAHFTGGGGGSGFYLSFTSTSSSCPNRSGVWNVSLIGAFQAIVC